MIWRVRVQDHRQGSVGCFLGAQHPLSPPSRSSLRHTQCCHGHPMTGPRVGRLLSRGGARRASPHQIQPCVVIGFEGG